MLLEEAIRTLKEAADPVRDIEKVPLARASGRGLALDLKASYDQPPFPRSPLDGYAVRGEDTICASEENPVELRILGKIYAGQVFRGEVHKGECVRLMTGAPIPTGANAVIRQEDTDYEPGKAGDFTGPDSRVKIFRGAAPYQNYVYEGEDYRKGDILLRAGTVLNGMRLGIAAGAGLNELEVYREPAITVISTGDEVIAPGQDLKAGKIYDSNQYTVVGRLADLGFSRVESMHCPDDPAVMADRIRKAKETSDLIITTGGVSVGEKDIMHQVMADLKGKKLFWKVSLKPGAPTLAFVLEEKLPVICLTGNPYGVAVNFELLIRPVLEVLSLNPGIRSKTCMGKLKNDSPKWGGVRRFMRGFYERESSEVTILAGSHASGTLSSMAACNCLVEIPEDSGGKAGEDVKIYQL